MSDQASPSPTSGGRRLRWARNVVKKWQDDFDKFQPTVFTQTHWEIKYEIHKRRYQRACALILADKLRKS